MSLVSTNMSSAGAAVKPVAAACYDNNLVNSQGMFLGDQPLRFALPLLLQVSLVLGFSAAAQLLLSRLGQSRFVTHMLVGIFLGPSVLGRSSGLRGALFSERGTYILESVSLVALILFLFSMGVKTDLSLLRHPSGRAVAVGVAGSLVPFAVTLPVFHVLQPTLPGDLRGTSLITELAVRLSLSSFPVIADALHDLDLLKHRAGPDRAHRFPPHRRHLLVPPRRLRRRLPRHRGQVARLRRQDPRRLRRLRPLRHLRRAPRRQPHRA